jgi:hypothetical protein
MLIAALLTQLQNYSLYGPCPTLSIQSDTTTHLRVFLPGGSLDNISEKFVIGVNGLDVKLLRHHTGVNCSAWVGDDAGCRGRFKLRGLLLLLLLCLV